MSVNLTIAIDRYGLPGSPLAYERLRLDWQDRELFARIIADSEVLGCGVYWYGDKGSSLEQTDAYGVPLRYIPAGALAAYLDAIPLRGADAAVLAFLKALPWDMRVILWWH